VRLWSDDGWWTDVSRHRWAYSDRYHHNLTWVQLGSRIRTRNSINCVAV